MRVIAIIPARLNSKRFPGKMIKKINGKPLILMTYNNLLSMDIFDKIIVATDSKKISNIIVKNGGQVFMSKKKHSCGTDRVCEASSHFNSDVVINVQGDEPFVNVKSIKKMINTFKDQDNKDIHAVSLFYKTNDPVLVDDKNCVKVVIDKNNCAMYFSRSEIPFTKNSKNNHEFFIHVGVYGFLRQSIIKFSSLKPSTLEKKESLECIRFIENAKKIKMIQIESPTIGIDTPHDITRAKNYLKSVQNV